LIFGGNLIIAQMVSNALVLLLAMTIHEAAHCYVADWMGDPTPRQMGKLTLNPLAHIYWVGWLMWVFIGFGILGTAPINPNRMRDPRVGGLLATAAGPFSNLLMAILFGIPFMLGVVRPSFILDQRAFIPTLPQLLTNMVMLNVLLFLFNLLPFFPLDGWHIVRSLLPPDLAYTWVRYQRESMYVLFGLIFLPLLTGGRIDILGWIVREPIQLLLRVLLGFQF